MPRVVRAVEVRVTGRVQGVFFRVEAARHAARLGIAGWIRNDHDGSVVAHLEGSAAAVKTMVAWCREGPPAARVDGVEVREVEPTGATSFEVER